MPVSKADILAKLDTFSTARDSAADAHTATIAAHENVTSVTVSEQAKIDAATANYDLETTNAKQFASAAEATEVAADTAEDDAFNELLAAITSFKNEE